MLIQSHCGLFVVRRLSSSSSSSPREKHVLMGRRTDGGVRISLVVGKATKPKPDRLPHHAASFLMLFDCAANEIDQHFVLVCVCVLLRNYKQKAGIHAWRVKKGKKANEPMLLCVDAWATLKFKVRSPKGKSQFQPSLPGQIHLAINDDDDDGDYAVDVRWRHKAQMDVALPGLDAVPAGTNLMHSQAIHSAIRALLGSFD